MFRYTHHGHDFSDFFEFIILVLFRAKCVKNIHHLKNGCTSLLKLINKVEKLGNDIPKD